MCTPTDALFHSGHLLMFYKLLDLKIYSLKLNFLLFDVTSSYVGNVIENIFKISSSFLCSWELCQHEHSHRCYYNTSWACLLDLYSCDIYRLV